MRLLILIALALVTAPAAFAQQAAPQPTIAFNSSVHADAAPVARTAAIQLEGKAEQLRLNALAYIGLGKTAEAERAVAKLVDLVPGYTPLPNDPAAFVVLVAASRDVAAPSAASMLVARGN